LPTLHFGFNDIVGILDGVYGAVIDHGDHGITGAPSRSCNASAIGAPSLWSMAK